MTKGEDTKQLILKTALKMAAASGLNDLTIGTLAVATGLSKSGLYAHFKSKEKLQLAVLNHAAEHFTNNVIAPAKGINDPLLKLQALTTNWLGWYQGSASTCIFIVAITEFDDQPGPVRDFIIEQQLHWVHYLEHKVMNVINSGKFLKHADAGLFVYQLQSLYLGTEMYRWLGKESDRREHFHRGIDKLFQQYLA